eukprot:scaffold23680_cov114-Isochrysis_galbana.AAC.1
MLPHSPVSPNSPRAPARAARPQNYKMLPHSPVSPNSPRAPARAARPEHEPERLSIAPPPRIAHSHLYGRRVHEVKVQEVVDPHGLHLEHGVAQVCPLDLGHVGG